MEIDPVMKKSIIASVIAAILVLIFIKPLLNYAWDLILFLSEYLYDGYLNRIYKTAAVGQTDRLSFMILFILMWLIASGLILKSISVFSKYRSVIEFANDEKSEELDEKQLTEKIIQIQKKIKKKRMAVSILLVFIVLLFFMIMGREYAYVILTSSFNQRLAVLSPKITDNERKEFSAKWASMTSRTEYLILKERMEKMASDKNVTLPEPLLD